MRTVLKYALTCVVVWVLVVALSECMYNRAHAHSWYPAHCCSTTDCHAVPQEELEEQPDGRWKHLPSGLTFDKDKTYPSQDRHWHVCIGDVVNYDGGGEVTIDAGKRPLCVFIQLGF